MHYELALSFLSPESVVLDMACGSGFGTQKLAQHVLRVIGIDNDTDAVCHVDASNQKPNVSFLEGDVLNVEMPSNSFDAIVAFEIIEHVDAIHLLEEAQRLLRSGGILILSTPQNSLGHIPAVPEHVMEYSLAEITEIVSKKFNINKIIGIKQGTIYFEDDPLGSNTFIVASKSVSP